MSDSELPPPSRLRETLSLLADASGVIVLVVTIVSILVGRLVWPWWLIPASVGATLLIVGIVAQISIHNNAQLQSLGSVSAPLKHRGRSIETGPESLALNIIPLPVDDNLAVELDRREIFRLSQHDFALQAITAKFVNRSRPPEKTTTAKGVGARVSIYEADRLDNVLLAINHVCWLNHEEPFIDLERDVTKRIVLAVFEPKSTGGFEPQVTFYENHMDRNAPLTRHPLVRPYEHLHLQVILTAGDYGEAGSERWYDLSIQYGSTWSFESFEERDKRQRNAIQYTSARSFDQHQLQFLAHRLALARGRVQILVSRNDLEALDFARQFHSLFKESGWQTEWFATLNPVTEKGLVIKVPIGTYPMVNSVLVAALREIGLTAQIVTAEGLGTHETVLVVGAKDS